MVSATTKWNLPEFLLLLFLLCTAMLLHFAVVVDCFAVNDCDAHQQQHKNQVSSFKNPKHAICVVQVPSSIASYSAGIVQHSRQINSRQINSRQINSRQIQSRQIPSGQISSRQIPLGQISSGQIQSRQISSRQNYASHFNAGHQDSAEKTNEQTLIGIKTAEQDPWLNALLSTLLISLAPYLIVFWIPINANDDENKPLLRIFLSFAAGGLLGDAFLHLIPHAIPHSHMAQIIVGLCVLAGMVVFLILEKVIRHLKGGHQHSSGSVKEKKSDGKEQRVKQKSSSVSEFSSKPDEFEIVRKRRNTEESSSSPVKEKSVSCERSEDCEEEDREEKNSTKIGDIPVSGYLNLAASFAHNFTDGLAIGASFLTGQGIGWVTTITILFHEIPHEVGDFALLIQSGCSKSKAIVLQLVTTVGAFAGCLVSLIVGATDTEAGKTSPVLAFTAGGFIYIAAVSIIPELLSDVKIIQSLKEILALLIGISLMVVIAVYEL